MNTLKLEVEGASQEEILRGLAVAYTVLERAGVTPHEAASAAFAREDRDVSGFAPKTEPSDAQMTAATACDAAEVTAAAACCAGWPNPPERVGFELTDMPGS